MITFHLTHDTVRRFLRSELSRKENQLVVRHLLTRCRSCLEIVREEDHAAGLRLTGRPPERPVLHLVQHRAARLG